MEHKKEKGAEIYGMTKNKLLQPGTGRQQKRKASKQQKRNDHK
jgi:hypothetical protein